MKLDTRPARCDLTSRECCKLLSGILGGALDTGLPVAAVRAVLIILRESSKAASGDLERTATALATFDGMVITDTIQLKLLFSMLGAACGAIIEQAAPDALEDAVDWILERDDDYWSALQQGMKAARAAVTNEN